jgi:two-component system response regulator RpaA
MSTNTIKKILVVEDDRSIRKLMEMKLHLAGYTVIPAENGLRAQEVINDGEVDIIFLDLNMPRLDGLKLIHWIREDKELNMPIFVLTAQNKENVIDKALSAGANDVFIKPKGIEQIVEKLKEIA